MDCFSYWVEISFVSLMMEVSMVDLFEIKDFLSFSTRSLFFNEFL